MRRMKWGIGAAAVVGLAWFLLNVFNLNIGGLGDGGGGDSRIGLPVMTETADPVPEAPPEQSEPVVDPVSVESSGDAISSGGVVEVMISDHDFLVRRRKAGNGEWVSTDIDTIAAAARSSPGNESGVRVRVLRQGSSRASAEERLVEALRSVGLTNSEIDLPETLVDP